MGTPALSALVILLGVVRVASAQSTLATPAPPPTPAYDARCGACHGPSMAGGTGPPILVYARYHTNAELSAVIEEGRPGMPALRLPPVELAQLFNDIRTLAGTNPTMATGGYTGSRGAGAGARAASEASATLGRALLQADRAQEAATAFSAALEGDPGNASLRYLLGTAFADLGRTEDAIREFIAAVASGIRQAELHNDLGVALARVGRVDQAALQFQQALRLDPNLASARENLGMTSAVAGPRGPAPQTAAPNMVPGAVVQAAGASPPAVPGGRGRGAGAGAGTGGAAAGTGRGSVTTIRLADGRTLAGRLAGQTDFDATLMTDTSFHLLAKDGAAFREKSVEPKANWLTYDGSATANRYSALDTITTGNVHKLAPAWIFPMVNSPRLEGTPVVVDGIMYVTGWNEIFALDATTGRQLWTHSEARHDGILGEAGSGANRGAAVSGDRVIMAMDYAHLVAFNRFTGQKLWDTEIAPFTDGYSTSVAPLIVGDLVLQGVSGGEEGARGFLDAYRIATGERAWRFYTIPAAGEKGAETWVGQAREHGCGATWLTGSYDPTLNLVYWGVGNPCPDYTGDERQGDNLYTSSVVALSATTGELKWHYQFTPHDTHDWDSTEPMILVDEMWRGQPRKLLLHPDRNGMFYVLDRATGEFLLGDKLSTKVTWLTGFTAEGRPIVDPASVSTREGVAACPNGNGGANWPAASYNPGTKLLYVRVLDSCGTYASHPDPLGTSGNRWFGRGTIGQEAQRALAELNAGYPTTSFLRAMDPFTGKKVWDVPIASSRSGVLSTAGGLVFMGGTGGLTVWDAKTGKSIWQVNVGQNSSASPMSYMVGGVQYIGLPATGMIVAYRLYE